MASASCGSQPSNGNARNSGNSGDCGSFGRQRDTVTSGVIARVESENGELSLHRRPTGTVELRVNGVFVIDTEHTDSERLLASAALDAVPGERLRALVGGLGLGYTLAELLRSDRVSEVEVIELEPDLVQWHRKGLVPGITGISGIKDAGGASGIHGVLDDTRVQITVGDIAAVVATRDSGTADLILLDVDNGPDFLVHHRNARLYRGETLRRCRSLLTPRGVFAVWSMSRSQELADNLRSAFGSCIERGVPVRLGERDERYWVYLAGRGSGLRKLQLRQVRQFGAGR
jgi:spermidine synthase